jgi:hypothetical protein
VTGVRIERPVRFRLAGARGYVHSSQVFMHFTSMLEELGAQGAGVEAARLFKFIRETSRNGSIVIAPAGKIDAKAAASTIAFAAPEQGEMLLAFFDDGEEAERGGAELVHTIKAVEHTGDYAGKVTLGDCGSPHLLFINLIEANKALHSATLLRSAAEKPPPYRFVYAENVPVRAMGDDVSLAFKARDVRHRGGLTYTLTEIVIAGCHQAAPVRICFSY